METLPETSAAFILYDKSGKKAVKDFTAFFIFREKKQIMYAPNYKTFEELAKQGNLVPLYREILADVETPVSVFMKLRDSAYAFLLESVEGGEKWGRYTFLGADPRLVFRISGDEVVIEEKGETSRHAHQGDPLRFLKEILRRYSPVSVEGLPRFYGGAVGFLGYEMVNYFERLPCAGENDLQTEEAVFLVTDTLILFDRVRHTIKVVACVHIDGEQSLSSLYLEATPENRCHGGAAAGAGCTGGVIDPGCLIRRFQFEHDAGGFPGQRGAGKGIHPGRRYHPGCSISSVNQ